MLVCDCTVVTKASDFDKNPALDSVFIVEWTGVREFSFGFLKGHSAHFFSSFFQTSCGMLVMPK